MTRTETQPDRKRARGRQADRDQKTLRQIGGMSKIKEKREARGKEFAAQN